MMPLLWLLRGAITKKRPGHKNDRVFKEGGDLLFHKRSIIGANGLNFSVRNGKR